MLRCVDYSIGRDNSSRNGDGFSRIDTGTALGHAAFMAVRGQTLPSTGRSVLPPNSVLKGVNQWLLQTVTAMANISLTVEVVRLDSAAYYGVDRNKEIMEAFLTHGYDCGACCPPLDCHRRVLTFPGRPAHRPSPVTTATDLTAEKLPYMYFMQSLQPYGFQVVTTKPVTVARTLTQKLWTWTLVFERNVWLVIAATLVLVGTAMWWLEAEWNEENFGEGGEGEKYTRAVRVVHGLGHGFYFSFAGFASKTEEFAPKTAAGRLLGICQAFAVFLIFCTCAHCAHCNRCLLTHTPLLQAFTLLSSPPS